MKKIKGISLIVCLAVFLAAGSAWAWNATDHVSVAPNGKGDVLIFPVYFTGAGWETKITVINTSLTRSIVAKVIIRSAHRSQELRDFLVYLSPTDVWTAKLYLKESDGRPYIWSDDPSTRNVAGNWASAAAPLDITLEDTCPGDTNEIGYIEIIQAASFELGDPPVTKARIRTAYEAWGTGQGPADLPVNVMVGYQEIRNTINYAGYGLNATALKNYDNRNFLDVTNPTNLGREARSNLVEVEAALSKNNLAIPYYSNPKGFVLSTFTFPTKQADFPCGIERWNGLYAGFPSPERLLSIFDLEENVHRETPPHFSPIPPAPRGFFPQEVNFIDISALPHFDEGWFMVQLPAGPTGPFNAADGVTSVSYTGAPVIATNMRFDMNAQGGWAYVAHDLGQVTVNGVLDLNYQYWNQVDNINR